MYSAKRFIYEAIDQGGRVFVHCNGMSQHNQVFVFVLITKIKFTRRYIVISSIRCDVRYGAFPPKLRRSLTPRPESAILYRAEWGFHDPNQGLSSHLCFLFRFLHVPIGVRTDIPCQSSCCIIWFCSRPRTQTETGRRGR